MGNKVLEQLIADRDRVNEQVDHVLATAEADGRGPSETEQKTIARCTAELAELEGQIAPRSSWRSCARSPVTSMRC